MAILNAKGPEFEPPLNQKLFFCFCQSVFLLAGTSTDLLLEWRMRSLQAFVDSVSIVHGHPSSSFIYRKDQYHLCRKLRQSIYRNSGIATPNTILARTSASHPWHQNKFSIEFSQTFNAHMMKTFGRSKHSSHPLSCFCQYRLNTA
jgi:hypothetical protein